MTWCPPPGWCVGVTDKLLWVSSVQCQCRVLCGDHPRTHGWALLPHQPGDEETNGQDTHGGHTTYPGKGGGHRKWLLNENRLGKDQMLLPQGHASALPRRPERTGPLERTRCHSWRSWHSRRSIAGPRHSPSDWPAGKSHRSGICRVGSGVSRMSLTSAPASPQTRSLAEVASDPRHPH